MFEKIARLVLPAASLFLLGSQSVRADVWTFRSDVWCPYNCAPEDKNPGYLVEILQGAAKANGHHLDYQLLPYARALKEAKEGRVTGIVGMLAQDRKEFLFSQPMGMDSNCLFVKEGSRLQYRSTSDFDKIGPIGIVQGYGYPDEFNQWGKLNPKKVEAISGEDILARQVHKLHLGRIGSFIENENVFRYSSLHSADLRGVELAGCMSGAEPVFIGFSARNPKATQVKLQVDAYIDSIRKSGELNKLLAKYGVAKHK